MTSGPIARGVPAHPDPTLPTGPTERSTDHAGAPDPPAHRLVAGRRHPAATPRRGAVDDDRGEITATTALIVILVIAAIAAGGVIASKIAANANNVPSP